MTMRACDACGRPYEAVRSTSRFCGAKCRKRKQRLGAVPSVLREIQGQFGPLTTVTRAELEAAGRLETSVGQSALILAGRLDMATADTGSSIAALVREHRATLAEAVRGVAVAGDPLDELRARRDAKFTG